MVETHNPLGSVGKERMEGLASCYLIFKALHILSFIAWMAGLLYLPRLFVYHTQAIPSSETYAVFLTMERRLLRMIMLPAMLATFLFGGLLAVELGAATWSSTWFLLKLVCVLLLAGLHGFMVMWWKAFTRGDNQKPDIFFRIINEIPFVIAGIIVSLAVFKP